MLRMAPPTVARIRQRAAELIRGNTEAWGSSILEDNGLALGRAAAARRSENCVSSKVFLDILDGRTTWSGKENSERHVNGCWHCIDLNCRLVEAIELLRGRGGAGVFA
jgi:hypothetical protein